MDVYELQVKMVTDLSSLEGQLRKMKNMIAKATEDGMKEGEEKVSLEKLFKSLGAKPNKFISGIQSGFFGTKTAGEAPEGQLGFMGTVVGKLGIVSLAVDLVGKKIGELLDFLKSTSPYLKGVFDIFNRAFMVFFRPFGDFLAGILKPVAIWLLRVCIAWMLWLKSINLKPLQDLIDKLVTGDLLGFVLDAFKILEGVGDWLWNNILVPGFFAIIDTLIAFGGWLWNALNKLQTDLILLIWNGIVTIAESIKPIGEWMWNTLINIFTSAFNSLKGIGQWMWNTITNVMQNPLQILKDFGKWIWDSLVNIFNKTLQALAGFGSWLLNQIKAMIRRMTGGLVGRASGGSVSSGTPYIVGEQGPELFVPNSSGRIIPNGGLGGQSVSIIINNPSFQNRNDIDKLTDEISRKLFSQITRDNTYFR